MINRYYFQITFYNNVNSMQKIKKNMYSSKFNDKLTAVT